MVQVGHDCEKNWVNGLARHKDIGNNNGIQKREGQNGLARGTVTYGPEISKKVNLFY